MEMEPGASATETAAFTQALAELKRRGSNLLVVGAAGGPSHADVCGRLLGDPSEERRRVFVTAAGLGGVVDQRHRRPRDTVVTYATTTRGASAARPSTGGPTSGPDAPSTGADDEGRTVEDLPSLGTAVGEAIDDVGGDDLDPGEFRLCVDTLRPLLEENDEQAVFRFLHAMTSDVRAVRGMGHYHLPVGFDDVTVRTLRPLFDAVVEVRPGDGRPQQRWHLHEADVTTGWLDL